LLEFSKDMKERFKVFAEAVARERKVAAEAAILDLVLPRPSVGLREMRPYFIMYCSC
jgi:predicted transcriptional regulator